MEKSDMALQPGDNHHVNEGILEGRIIFEMSVQTFETDLQATALERALTALGHSSEGFAILISCTRDVQFAYKGNEAPVLLAFKEFWEKRQTLDPEQLWAYRVKFPSRLVNLWWAEFTKAQNLWAVDPAELPKEMLTETQKAEADTPGSPLAWPGKHSRAG